VNDAYFDERIDRKDHKLRLGFGIVHQVQVNELMMTQKSLARFWLRLEAAQPSTYLLLLKVVGLLTQCHKPNINERCI